MDSLSKKIQNLGIHDIRNAARFAQNVIVQYEPYQVDIRRATNTDAWGPTPKHLSKVLRHRYQVPMYLMTEYILKRLVDHIATRPKNLYEKARKDYVNYGAEWRVVLKCLTVIEFLMLNVDEGDELNQIRSSLQTHKHILTREVAQYRVKFSNDGKMEVHERGIRKKGETIVQFMEDPHFLKRERNKNKQNASKIRHQTETSIYNANAMDSASLAATTGTNNGLGANGYDYVDDSDEFDDAGADVDASGVGASIGANVGHPQERKRTTLEEQRRQRREILRERIRSTEQQRKKQVSKDAHAQKQQEEIPDLLDMDFDAPAPTSPSLGGSTAQPTTDKSGTTQEDNDEEDDGFGDFQTDANPWSSSEPAVQPNTAGSPALDDLLGSGPSKSNGKPAANTTNSTGSAQNKDLFADLYTNSKSLI